MTITGEAIQGLQSRYGFTQPEIGLISGYAPRSIANWLKGTRPTPAARQKFVELRRLFTALEGLVEDPAEVKNWLNEPNTAFEGSTPRQVIERGESDRLWHMIHFIESG